MTQINKNMKEVLSTENTADSSRVFSTYDLGVAAALLSFGFEMLPLNRGDPRRTLFVFKQTGNIEEVANFYFANRLDIKARAYFDSLKAIKNMIHDK